MRLTRHILFFLPLAITYFPSRLLGQPLHDLWWSAFLFAVESSGAALTKFIQWAATRPDVFPEDVCNRMSKLHRTAQTHQIEFSKPFLADLFGKSEGFELVSIEDLPVGSGCIAQVHRAVIRKNGEEMKAAVKLVHPGVTETVWFDIDLLRNVTNLLEYIPSVKWLSLRESVEEFAQLIGQQLDMRLEADNLERFSHNFRNSPDVSFPLPIRPLVRQDVLVETFEDGLPLSDFLSGERAGEDTVKRQLAKIGVKAFLQMCFKDNFIHGDLHPGNILVSMSQSGTPSGLRMTFLDAGITTELTPDDKRNFVALFSAIVQGDGRRAGRLMIDHAREHECSNPDAFCDGIGRLVDHAVSHKLRLDKIQAGKLLLDAFTLACVHRVKVESNFASVCIAIMVLEGVGRNLDPTVDILRAASPILLEQSREMIRSGMSM